jgi:1-deoxyxylulose-5-phosphate synthase
MTSGQLRFWFAALGRRQGKLRYVALSNHPAWQMTEALWIADDRRLASAPVAAQVMYSLLDRSAERELSGACARFGLSIIPYAPLHGGLLAELSVLEREIAGGKRYGGPGYSESEIAVARQLGQLARGWGLGTQQVSLAWLLSRPAVASVIIGAETREELHANASAADIELTQEQLDAASALTAETRA